MIRKWESTGNINPVEIPAADSRRIPFSNGYILHTHWDLLDVELKPKGKKIELWTHSKHGSKT